MERATLNTPVSTDPRMVRAIDGMLGLYKACYEITAELRKNMVVKEPDAPYGMPSNPEPTPDHLKQALLAAAKGLNEWNGWWVLGGGLAVNYYGRQRATKDVDFFCVADREQLQPILNALAKYDVRSHSLEGPSFMPPDGFWYFVPLQFGLPDALPVNVDLLISTHEFMGMIHTTGIETEVFGTRVRLIGAEALMVLKLQAYRDRDKADVHDILKNRPSVNQELLQAWIKRFKLGRRFSAIEKKVANQSKRLG